MNDGTNEQKKGRRVIEHRRDCMNKLTPVHPTIMKKQSCMTNELFVQLKSDASPYDYSKMYTEL